jgi:hypothetical protein
MEHSERGRWVTDEVSLWINNDGDYYETAHHYAHMDYMDGMLTGNNGLLAEYLGTILQGAVKPSAPWHVAQELSPNDYERIDWRSVADDLLSE